MSNLERIYLLTQTYTIFQALGLQVCIQGAPRMQDRGLLYLSSGSLELQVGYWLEKDPLLCLVTILCQACTGH